MSTLEPRPRAHLRLVWVAPLEPPAPRPAPSSLDRKRPHVYPAPMGLPTTQDLLRDQPWARITAKLTAFAFRRTRKRSWELAEELAQEAIAQAWAKESGWDPAKGPLFKYLATLVIGLALQEWRRKRNSFEVLMDYPSDDDDQEWENPIEQIPSGEEAVDERLHRQRVAVEFRETLERRVGKSENHLAPKVMQLMMKDVVTAPNQARALKVSIDKIREARRVIFFHAGVISKELGLELEAKEDEEVAE